MKKTVSTVMLLVMITLGFNGSIGAKDNAITDPKFHASCVDSEGKWIVSKQCGTQSEPNCGCLFHQIEEFVKGLFD